MASNLYSNNYKELAHKKTTLSIARINTMLTLEYQFKNRIIVQNNQTFSQRIFKSIIIYLNTSSKRLDVKESA